MCPGTERPRPWRTRISSSTSSSATQVRVPGAAGRLSAACGPGPRGTRCLAGARAPSPPGASLQAAPLHFRSARAGDVGTASGRGLAGRGRGPRPEQPCSWGPWPPFAMLGLEVCDRRGRAVQGRQGPAQTLASHFGASSPPRRKKRSGTGEPKVMDGRRVLGFLNSPTFSDLRASASAWAKHSLVWDSQLRKREGDL